MTYSMSFRAQKHAYDADYSKRVDLLRFIPELQGKFLRSSLINWQRHRKLEKSEEGRWKGGFTEVALRYEINHKGRRYKY